MPSALRTNSEMLGELITRQLTEFDRTLKTYGGELVERIGQRTQDVNDTLKTYVDGFDGKVGETAAVMTERARSAAGPVPQHAR